MRGRTNVGGGNGIFVNGDIEFYTIAEGNSITAGDFVSRKVIPSIKQLYSSNVELNGGDKVGEGLYLFVANNYLTLIEWNGANVEIVHSYTGYEVPQYYYEESTGYIWGIISNPFYRIARFKVENKKIILEETSSDTITGGNNVLGIYVKENVFIVFSHASGDITFYCYTMAGDGTVSTVSFKKRIATLSTGGSVNINILNNCDSRFYAVIKIVYGSISSMKNEIFVSSINVSDAENEVYVKNIHTLSSYTANDIKASRVTEKNGKAFFLYSDLDSSIGDVYLHVYNMETENNTIHKVSDSTLLPSGISSRYLEMSKFVTDDIFLAKINENFFLVKYLWLTDGIERIGNTVVLDNNFYSAGIMVVNQGHIARIGRYSTWFTVEGEILMAGEEQKIIQSYDAEMGSIGLAKNSGKPGDSIAVYVPRR